MLGHSVWRFKSFWAIVTGKLQVKIQFVFSQISSICQTFGAKSATEKTNTLIHFFEKNEKNHDMAKPS